MSKSKPTVTRDTVPEGFTVSMALVDALPVLFFGGSMVVISLLFHSPLFLTGALLCLLGGAGKVLWKILVATRKKNVWPLFIQMRILMPAGFALILLSVILNAGRISLGALGRSVLSFPSVIFFAVGLLGMVLMGVFASRLDSSDARSNWIEQLTNGVAQACIFVGLLLLR